MFLSLNTDVFSGSVQRNLFKANFSLMDTMQRLSTGMRINSAKDNAASFALSANLSNKISGLNMVDTNIKTGLGKLYTYEGYLGGMADSLQKIRNLAVQSANGVYSASERSALDKNARSLLGEIEFATKDANSEIGAKNINTSRLINDIQSSQKLNQAEALAQGYTLINNASEFVSAISSNLAGKYILMGDIDMSELGTLSNSAIMDVFRGEFNGNGNVIKNLSIDTGGAVVNNIGLFSRAIGAEITNIGVENVNIIATASQSVGGLVGYNQSNITNSYSTGAVSGSRNVGGLVGYNTAAVISDSYSGCSVIGNNNYIGGLVGYSSGGIILSSYATGNVKGLNNTGGLAGELNSASAKDSYSTGTVTGNNIIGGFAGMVNSWNGGTVVNCYATGDIFANNQAGGFAGRALNNALIETSYAIGDVTGNLNVGGFVGVNNGSLIQNSYTSGTALGVDTVGGFVGNAINNSIIKNSYTTASVSGTLNLGGFAGLISTATVEDTNFYKNNMTTDTVGSDAVIYADADLASWDTSVWDTSSSPPELNWDKEQNIFSVHVGTNNNESSKYNMKYLGMDFNEIGGINVDLSSVSEARKAIDIIDKAINYLTEKRSQAGGGITSLDSMIGIASGRSYSLQKSNSSIVDADMAVEMSNLTKQKILTQFSSTLLQQVKKINSDMVLGLLNL